MILPYVPPRITQAELQTYSALDPSVCNVYDPANQDIQHQYPYEGGENSPSESHHSIEGNWSNSSSSSASHDHLVEPTYSQTLLPPRHATYPQYYPAYHRQNRLGLEHAQYGEQHSNTGDDAQVPIPSQVNYPATSSRGSSSSSSISVINQPPNTSTFSAVSPTLVTDSTRSLSPNAGPYL